MLRTGMGHWAETDTGRRIDEENPMGKRGRKKRDRKKSSANHGKRPNS